MDIKKKQVTLRFVFLEYLFVLILSLFFALGIPYTLFYTGASMELWTYENYGEIAAKELKPIIAASNKFNKNVIPPDCRYVLLNKNFNVIENNMNETDLKDAISYARGNLTSNNIAKGHVFITRNDGYCILQYYIGSRYTRDWMNYYLPNPNILAVTLIIFNSLLACLITIALFARRLKKQLLPLLDATQNIKNQNLDFEVHPSKIKEFNDVLLSFDDMKLKLKDSLKKQWRMEQMRKDQTSALVHDIKTPLTVISGNAELLYDSDETDEQQEYTRYIMKSSSEMQQYIKALIGICQEETGYPIKLSKVNTSKFIEEILYQINGMASTKKLQVEFTKEELPYEFTSDSILLKRAVMNIISNAVDYSQYGGKVYFKVESIKGCIRFCITDCGRGFSSDELKHACGEFYMGDSSRTSKLHYGIGLYISKSIAEKHGGKLHIANSKITGGAQVTIEIPA